MFPADEHYELLERLAPLDSDLATLPLRAGASTRCDDYGAFRLAWKSAPNLQASYAIAESLQIATAIRIWANNNR